MAADPFEDILNLEDQFYQEGFQQGAADGKRAGQVEGRTLGLENGFKKFAESGRLYGRAVVWANRLGGQAQAHSHEPGQITRATPAIPNRARLQKNIRTLYALVEPGTLSTANTDEAVNDFDDRIKRASGKARIIEKMAGDLPEMGPSAAPLTA